MARWVYIDYLRPLELPWNYPDVSNTAVSHMAKSICRMISESSDGGRGARTYDKPGSLTRLSWSLLGALDFFVFLEILGFSNFLGVPRVLQFSSKSIIFSYLFLPSIVAKAQIIY